MAQNAPVRSYLFVPANRPERIPKALDTGAGAVIVDLEDAVAPADKGAARDALAGYVANGRPVFVRINGADSPWFADDLAVCKAPGVAGVFLPKAEQVAAVEDVARRIGAGRHVIPIIESGAGFDNARALASCGQAQRLAFGSIDFQVDLGIDGEGDELLYFRSQIVLMSRLGGLQPPVDGVTVNLQDPEATRADTLRGRRLGFGAKLCIHPKQVAVVESCFRPTEAEIAWAKRVLDAARSSGGSAVAVDGKMVDMPVIRKAEEILAAA